MTTLTWTGQGKTDANPNDPNNWWPAQKPNANDNVIFPWGNAQLSPNILWAAASITIEGGSQITFSSIPYISGNLHIAGGGTLYVTAVTGTLTVTGLNIDNGGKMISARPITSNSIFLTGGSSFTAQNGIDVTTTVTVEGGSNGQVWGPVEIDGQIGGNNANVSGGSTFDCHGGGSACYFRGTMILTNEGEIAIEDLQPGMKTHDGCEIVWVGKGIGKVEWIDINWGEKTLTVTSDHLIVYNEVLYPAKNLLTIPGVSRSSKESFEYFHLQCLKHTRVIANGHDSESFLDVDGRQDLKTVSGERLNIRYDKSQSFLPIIAF